jgi:hypothetical protein
VAMAVVVLHVEDVEDKVKGTEKVQVDHWPP